MAIRAMRLKENHPFLKQLEEIFATMDKLGITITPTCDGNLLVRSKEYGEYYLMDLEMEYPSWRGSGIFELPPALEYKLVREE